MGPNQKQVRTKALLIAFFGFFLVIGLLKVMNQTLEKDKQKISNQVQFETKKVKKKKQQKIKKKEVAKKQKSQVKSLKPKMDLAFASSGLDLGIDILGLSAGDSRLLSQQGQSVMTEDVVDRLPEVQYREPVPYPESAKEKNITGHVTLNILINEDGEVDQVKLLDSMPEGIFDQAAVSSVKAWSFSPAEYKGRFVSVWVKQKLQFKVN